MSKDYTLQEYFSIIGRILKGIVYHWKIIFITALLGAGSGWLISYFEKPYYSADVTFFIDEGGKNSGLMGFANLAQQFKLPEAFDFNNKKTLLVELLKSKEIYIRTLLKKSEYKGKEELIINQFLKNYELPKLMVKEYKIDSTVFKSVNTGHFTPAQVKVMNFVYKCLSDELVIIDEKLGGIIDIGIKSKDEEFSFNFVNAHIESLLDFYEKEHDRKNAESYEYLMLKKDSLEMAISSAEGTLAKIADSKHQSTRADVYISQKNLEKKIEILNDVLEETLKSLELANLNLALQTSTIKIIDKPKLPLDEFIPDRLKYAVIGALAGFLLSFTLVFFFQTASVNREMNEV
jgi:LPS O-antigen subunit length determinant protein (WzzB/FepE family)